MEHILGNGLHNKSNQKKSKLLQLPEETRTKPLFIRVNKKQHYIVLKKMTSDSGDFYWKLFISSLRKVIQEDMKTAGA